MPTEKKRNKTIKRGGLGKQVRIAYSPGYGTSMRGNVYVTTDKPTGGLGAAMKEMEEDMVEFFKGILATDVEREEKKKKTSTYVINILERPEVADVKENRETKICDGDKKSSKKGETSDRNSASTADAASKPPTRPL